MSCILNIMNNPAPDDWSGIHRKRAVRDTMIEFMATTVFVCFGTLSAVSTGAKLVDDEKDADVARVFPIAFCFGISIMVLAYSIGHLTGGHMNPGVSLLMYFKLEMSLPKMLCYWTAQFVGAILGAAFTLGCTATAKGTSDFLLGANTLNTSMMSVGNGFLIEFVGSFFFYFVIAQTALDKRGIATTSFPAIPIGFVLVVVHICLIPFTGCGVNPARTVGPTVVNCLVDGEFCDAATGPWYWIYFAGPFLASFLVAEVTNLLEWEIDEEPNQGQEEVKMVPTKDDVPPVVEKEETPSDDA